MGGWLRKAENKLGLSWAKLSSSWDWNLFELSVDLVYLDLVKSIGWIDLDL